MKKVLVTGADGFIGSHLVEMLLKANYEVRAFCQYNSNSNWGWLEHIPENLRNNLEVVLGDIRDASFVRESVKECDTVFHLAALIAIPYSYVAPLSYIETNIIGTLNIVQAAKDLKIKKVVHTSTSETYGTAQFIPISEKHPLVGQSPYAASKIGADQIALSFWRSFETPVTILRPFNTYGPRQSNRAVIPSIITQLSSGQKEIFLGKLTPTRDFNFVYDTCKAFIEVALSDKTIGKVLNAASNFEISIEDTAKLIAEVMNKEIYIKYDSNRMRPEGSEVERLFGDNTLIKTLTNWKPVYGGINGFKKGLKITADWFVNKNNLSLYRGNKYEI